MTISPTAQRIKDRWSREAAFQNNTLSGGTNEMAVGQVYSGSNVSDTSADFLGDWRSADSWQRFDMWRVRNRCRQVSNGNPTAIGYMRNMRNNVLSHAGMHFKSVVKSSKAFGDTNEGVLDKMGNDQIEANYAEQGRALNFTTKKINSRRDTDNLLLNALITDGEVFIRKIRGFENDYGFAWQVVNPDYVDHNLNRIEDGRDQEGKQVAEPGNITKMGVEQDKDFKFPVAYWLLARRPNDYFYNYASLSQQRYIRVPAAEMIHMFVQNIDAEQTRGWPWMFAAVVNLFRADKFQEAALINATIGAMKTTYFTKQFPTGYEPSPDELKNNGKITRPLNAGEGEELPWGVDVKPVDMRYPDAELGPFMAAMNLATSMTFGTSYASTTNDLSQANFVSSRLGQVAEQEFYKSVQDFFIEHWKIPGFDEELYRAMLVGKVRLPVSKFDKFNQPKFTGRRWVFVQPVDEMKAMEMALNNRVTSITAEIEKQGGDASEVFKQIAEDEKTMEALGFERLSSVKSIAPTEEDTAGDGGGKATPKKKPEPAKE